MSLTIYDISKLAGVSIATVSRVLNGSQNVRSSTREKVLSIIESNGYTPNAFARGMGLHSIRTIGILCADSSDIFLAKAVYYLEQELQAKGYEALLCCTGYDFNVKSKYLSLILSKKVDAVILVGTPKWSQEVNFAADMPLEFDNVMYSVHYYAATHKKELRDKAQYALNKGAAVFIDEYSNCDASGNGIIDDEEAHAWAKFVDENNLSYAQWNLSNRDESSAMVKADCTKTSDWTDEDLTTTGKWMVARLAGEIRY